MERFLLRTVVFTIVITMIWLVFGTIITNAVIERTLKNGVYTEKEVTTLKEISGVPKGLSSVQVRLIVNSKIEQVRVRDEVGEKIYSLPLPLLLMKSRTVYADQKFAYHNGKWIPQSTPDRSSTSCNAYLFSALWLWLVAVLIAVVSAINVVSKAGTGKLLMFYAAILMGVLVGVLGSVLTGMYIDASSESPGFLVGAFVGVFMGCLTGGYASNLSPKDTRGELGMIAGLVAGGISGYFAGIFAIVQNEIVVRYFFFLLGVELIFLIVIGISYAYTEQQREKAEIASKILE